MHRKTLPSADTQEIARGRLPDIAPIAPTRALDWLHMQRLRKAP